MLDNKTEIAAAAARFIVRLYTQNYAKDAGGSDEGSAQRISKNSPVIPTHTDEIERNFMGHIVRDLQKE